MSSFQLGITKIKDIEFFVDENITINSNELVSINFEVNLNLNAELKLIDLILGVRYLYENEQCFLRIKTSNVFVIPTFDQFERDNNMNPLLPDSLLVTMLSLSISHTRALLAKNSLGTKFVDYYIPIVNPSELAADLFKKQE
jgi:hypothetical protein